MHLRRAYFRWLMMLAVSMNDVMTWVFSLVQMTSTVAYTVSRRYGFYEEVLCSSGKRHCSWRENIKSIFITRISLGNTFQRKFCKCPTSLKCPTSMKSPTMSYISLKCPTSLCFSYKILAEVNYKMLKELSFF